MPSADDLAVLAAFARGDAPWLPPQSLAAARAFVDAPWTAMQQLLTGGGDGLGTLAACYSLPELSALVTKLAQRQRRLEQLRRERRAAQTAPHWVRRLRRRAAAARRDVEAATVGAVARSGWGHRLTVFGHQYAEVDNDTQQPIPARVYHLRFVPSGASFLTAGDDGIMKLWETSSGRLSYSVRRHFRDIVDLDLSPDGSSVVSSCTGNDVRAWDLGRVGWRPRGRIRLPSTAAFVRFVPGLPHLAPAKRQAVPEPPPAFFLTASTQGVIQLHALDAFFPLRQQDSAGPSSQASQEPSPPAASLDPVSATRETSFSHVKTSRKAEEGPLLEFDVADYPEEDETDRKERLSAENPRETSLAPTFSYLSSDDEEGEDAAASSSSASPDETDAGSVVCSLQLATASTPPKNASVHSIDFYRRRLCRVLSTGALVCDVCLAIGTEPAAASPAGPLDESPPSCRTNPAARRTPDACPLIVRFTFSFERLTEDSTPTFSSVEPSVFPLRLPEESAEAPDVAFATARPSLLVGGNDTPCYIYDLCQLESPAEVRVRGQPLALQTLTREKFLQGEFRAYHHPLAHVTNAMPPQLWATTAGEAAASSEFYTSVTSMAWLCEDAVVAVGTSAARRGQKVKDVYSTKTKETEIAFFSAKTGRRILSIIDTKLVKGNVAFIRPCPADSALVCCGTYCGALLLLDLRHFASVNAVNAKQQQQTTISPERNKFYPRTNVPKKLGGRTEQAYSSEQKVLSSVVGTDGRIRPGLEQLVLVALKVPGVSFLEGNWHPLSGELFICSRSDGSFTVLTQTDGGGYAVSCNDSFCLTPVEQFLESDFALLEDQAHGRLTCPFTGVAAEDMKRGLLVGAKRIPDWLAHPHPLGHCSGLPEDLRPVDLTRELLERRLRNQAALQTLYANLNSQRVNSNGTVLAAAEFSASRRRSRPAATTTQSDSAPAAPTARYGTILASGFASDDASDVSWQETRTGGRASPADADNSENPPSMPEDDHAAYWTFWDCYSDPLNRLRSVLARVPLPDSTAAPHSAAANALLLAMRRAASDREQRIDGVPIARIEFIALLGRVLTQPAAHLATLSRREREQLAAQLHAACRAHRAAQRRRRQGRSDVESVEEIIPSDDAEERPPLRRRRRQQSSSEEDEDVATPPEPAEVGLAARRLRRTTERRRICQSDSDENDENSTPVLVAVNEPEDAAVGEVSAAGEFNAAGEANAAANAAANAVGEANGGASADSNSLPPFVPARSWLAAQPERDAFGLRGRLQGLCLVYQIARARDVAHGGGSVAKAVTAEIARSLRNQMAGLMLLHEQFAEGHGHSRWSLLWPLCERFPVAWLADLQEEVNVDDDDLYLRCGLCQEVGCVHSDFGCWNALLLVLLTCKQVCSVSAGRTPRMDDLRALQRSVTRSIAALAAAPARKSRRGAGGERLPAGPPAEFHRPNARELYNSPFMQAALRAADNFADDVLLLGQSKQAAGGLVGPICSPSTDHLARHATRGSMLAEAAAEFVHSSCFLASFCHPPGGFPTAAQHATERERLRATTCSRCSLPGAALCCCKCGAAFHWTCGREFWVEDTHKNAVGRTIVPDPLEGGSWCCPAPLCTKRFRNLEHKLDGSYFASSAGVEARFWAAATVRSRGDFVPQLGDLVRFFVTEISDDLNLQLCAPFLLHSEVQEDPPDCAVIDIEWQFSSGASSRRNHRPSPQLLVAELTLLVLPPHAAAGNCFKFKYHPSHGQLPIVLLSVVLAGLDRKIERGAPCFVFLDEALHGGVVREVDAVPPERPVSAECAWTALSNFPPPALPEPRLLTAGPPAAASRTGQLGGGGMNAVKISWLNGDEEPQRFHLWEVYNENEEPCGMGGCEALAEDRRLFLMDLVAYLMKVTQSGQTRRSTAHSRRAAIRKFAVFERVVPFSADELQPWEESYLSTIPLPMSLQLIRDRLQNNYYRREVAVLYDVQLVYRNCVAFNESNSLVSLVARDLVESFVRILLQGEVPPLGEEAEDEDENEDAGDAGAAPPESLPARRRTTTPAAANEQAEEEEGEEDDEEEGEGDEEEERSSGSSSESSSEEEEEFDDASDSSSA